MQILKISLKNSCIKDKCLRNASLAILLFLKYHNQNLHFCQNNQQPTNKKWTHNRQLPERIQYHWLSNNRDINTEIATSNDYHLDLDLAFANMEIHKYMERK